MTLLQPSNRSPIPLETLIRWPLVQPLERVYVSLSTTPKILRVERTRSRLFLTRAQTNLMYGFWNTAESPLRILWMLLLVEAATEIWRRAGSSQPPLPTNSLSVRTLLWLAPSLPARPSTQEF